jgi:3-mercaptopropionate dioxygenase
VSGFAPPETSSASASRATAISIHLYGADVSRIGTSARRYYYDLSVVSARSAA